ncbi:DUF2141 domain-containing protein [Psychroserpens ponticola]|uniref:DUF2141 domain-containing protein n=1 Tax=Psychroserpens ponticola TaxID=2932268 RepID=A0ABY7RUD4_9FLAO|nr:DUF2141 domain-containing protein [Psychroserpens ponticola]WCO00727.1 DUF2141 domain-containing protein [Psychroserpens ponticola]
MSTLAKIIVFVLLSQTLSYAQESEGQNVTVKIVNLNSNAGHLFISLFNTEASFLNKGYKSTISSIENNSCEITFKDVPKGIYAISFFHDENENKKMDTNFLGIPKEDYGCSNNARGFMGPPKWEDAKFEIKNQSITQTITL